MAKKRIEEKLGGVDRYATAHFDGSNPYQTAIGHTMVFLRHVLEGGDLGQLRRLTYSLSAGPRARPAPAANEDPPPQD